MKMLFLGGVFSESMESEILTNTLRGSVQYAANRFQWSLIDGFLKNDQIDLEVLSAPFVGTYPKEYRRLFIHKNKEEYNGKITCNYVSFINFWGVRNISRKNKLKKEIEEFILVQDKEKVIFVYSPHTPFLQAAVCAKLKDPRIHICLIVPDLPQYMNLNEKKSFLYTMLKKIDIKMFESVVKKVDSFVLITKQMKNIIKVGDRPFTVIEGIVNQSEDYSHYDLENNKQVSSNKTIVYTGTLNKKFGIVNLVKAFNEIDDPDLTLKICGRGDASEIIEEYSKIDNRINYLGQLSNEDAVKLQRSATVLVNPRPNNEDFTKYSFPYKTMEYLVSGNPVIAFKLDGIPDEYDEYLFYFKDNTIEAIKNGITEVLNLTDEERTNIGNKAKKFILENKTATIASMKIYRMINTHLT
jgi:glycosyltransferase involved in cell wall biosynthesis